jgi:aminoglycoside/choline kinase family phosphotransferase
MPPFAPVFIHRDYHPANLIWHGEQIAGVVDWVSASIGPAEFDVGHCRGNLIREAGMHSADAWVETCIRRGVIRDYAARWDVVVAVDFLPDERMSAREMRALDRLLLAGLRESTSLREVGT